MPVSRIGPARDVALKGQGRAVDISNEKVGRELGSSARSEFLINWRYDRFVIAIPLDLQPDAG